MPTAISQPEGADSQSCTDTASGEVEVQIVEHVVEITLGGGRRVLVARNGEGNDLCLHQSPETLTLTVPQGVLDNGSLADGSSPRPKGLPGSGIKVSALPDRRSESGWAVQLKLSEGTHILFYIYDQDEPEILARSHGEVMRVAVWLPHETFTGEQDG